MEAILTRLGYGQPVIDNFKREGVTPEAATLMNGGQFQQLGIEGCGRQAILVSRCRAFMLSTQETAGSSLAANRLTVSNLFQPYKKTKKRKSSLTKLEFVCLSSPDSSNIPKDFTKKVLRAAGLGIKVMWLDSQMSGMEMREHLFSEYPKLKDGGGFEYLRTPGHKKELEIIPLPPGGGYSVSNLKAIVGQAKVYLRPIQRELNVSGEVEEGSVDDDTLQECFSCGEEIPETKLKVHKRNCSGGRDEGDVAGSSSSGSSATPVLTHTVVPADRVRGDDGAGPSSMAPTPQRQLAPAYRSRVTGEDLASPSRQLAPVPDRYFTDYVNLLEPVDSSDDELQHVKADSLKDTSASDDTILKARMQEQVRNFQSLREEETIDIVVRRKKVIRSAADAINTQAGFSFYKNPVIVFSGEEAVDLGGPKREFFTLATRQLTQLGIFEGKEKRMYFTHEIGLLEKGLYRLAGQVIAWSILHGGPGFPALHPWLYTMMCGLNMTDGFCIEDITDPDVLGYLQMIENCSSEGELAETIGVVGDWAASNGCTGIYGMKMENKEEIVTTLFKQHIYYRCKSEIDDFQKGLGSVGDFWNLVQDDPSPFRCLFVWSDDYALTFPDTKKLFHINLSDNFALSDKEDDTIYCWEQFLRKAGNGECSKDIKLENGLTETTVIGLHHIIRFCTGADAIPPLGFNKQIDLKFFSITPGTKPLPTASTCGLEIHLPRGMDDQKAFAEMMMDAILCSPGFGKK